MKHVLIVSAALCITTCVSLADPEEGAACIGLTQSQLAKKLGFPLRVFMLDSKAQGGPGLLFWVYYQRSPSGKVEEKMFAFEGSPLKVSSAPVDVTPSRFLSLERPSDSLKIIEYEAQHGR